MFIESPQNDGLLACLIRLSISWRCSVVQSTPRLVPSIRFSRSVTRSDGLPPEGLPLPAAGCTSVPDSGFSVRTEVSRVALWRAACATNKNKNSKHTRVSKNALKLDYQLQKKAFNSNGLSFPSHIPPVSRHDDQKRVPGTTQKGQMFVAMKNTRL